MLHTYLLLVMHTNEMFIVVWLILFKPETGENHGYHRTGEYIFEPQL